VTCGFLRGLSWSSAARAGTVGLRRPRRFAVSDKSPHKTTSKKPGKSIKQKRAEKRAKHSAEAEHDLIANAKRH
jgi:hypothetical protein